MLFAHWEKQRHIVNLPAEKKRPDPSVSDIAVVSELTIFIQRYIPPVGFIINVVFQIVRYLHGFQFIDIVSAQIVIVGDVRVHLIAVQILRQVYHILQAAAVVTYRHCRLELVIFALAHFIQLGSKIIQLVQIDVFSQLVV